MKLDWQNKESAETNISDKRVQPFLFQEGSLTHYIQQCCSGSFKVEVITESWNQAMSDETELLSLANNEKTFIRKSLLKNDDQILVYARTIIPEKTLTGKNEKLTMLGDKPLGDVLFNDTSTYRAKMRYAKIPVDCELHNEATKGLGITIELWGRRSLVLFEQQPLLITEIFLPAILKCGKN